MGKLYFKNLDNEWEQFPTDEDLEAARKSADDLEELGFRIICQMCNERPSVREIKARVLHHEWTCPKCHTINSAGKGIAMTRDELLAKLDFPWIDVLLANPRADQYKQALRAVVELHKPYDSQDTPHEVAMGWCKGCSIEYSINEYASQPYPCPTIQAIEKHLM